MTMRLPILRRISTARFFVRLALSVEPSIGPKRVSLR
jgi:hypothetical protein